MLSVENIRLGGGTYAQLFAGNNSGTKISLRIPVERLFEDEGQLLMNQVFGPALAYLIRDEGKYKEMEYEQDQKSARLARVMKNPFGPELETF